MNRRDFTKYLAAAAVGLMAGSRVVAAQTDEPAAKPQDCCGSESANKPETPAACHCKKGKTCGCQGSCSCPEPKAQKDCCETSEQPAKASCQCKKGQACECNGACACSEPAAKPSCCQKEGCQGKDGQGSCQGQDCCKE